MIYIPVLIQSAMTYSKRLEKLIALDAIDESLIS